MKMRSKNLFPSVSGVARLGIDREIRRNLYEVTVELGHRDRRYMINYVSAKSRRKAMRSVIRTFDTYSLMRLRPSLVQIRKVDIPERGVSVD